jgi:hypothetical protein
VPVKRKLQTKFTGKFDTHTYDQLRDELIRMEIYPLKSKVRTLLNYLILSVKLKKTSELSKYRNALTLLVDTTDPKLKDEVLVGRWLLNHKHKLETPHGLPVKYKRLLT